eukprot:CAMPEP_0170539358 /NCGR_PEP_ID=MMETSP0209-20121228/103877_1 /TAXON_ID=665100 ORGANISM="Litonotus pictus, Strain P1" /NCGR_SAMPLE_ID=MMETSP0209 /ASSEMBLY_ACC=CAM_ASM_000301 /LENGTH=213 /DNA_ID=CAMNT_0010841261 /DNA_START=277 /DNA_END=919 /DNA_ORIENTATION=+
MNSLEYYLESNPFYQSQKKYSSLYHIHRTRSFKGSLNSIINESHSILLDFSESDLLDYFKNNFFYLRFYVKKKKGDWDATRRKTFEEPEENIYFKTLNIDPTKSNEKQEGYFKGSLNQDSGFNSKFTFRDYNLVSDSSNLDGEMNNDTRRENDLGKEEGEIKNKNKKNLPINSDFGYFGFGKTALAQLLTSNDSLKLNIPIEMKKKGVTMKNI